MDAVKDEVVYPQAPQPPAGPPPVPARSAPLTNFHFQARSAPPPPPSRTNAYPPPPPPPPSQPPVATVSPPPPPPPPPPPTRTPLQRQDMATSQGWFYCCVHCVQDGIKIYIKLNHVPIFTDVIQVLNLKVFWDVSSC